MSASADDHTSFGEGTLGKKDVESWLHNDVEAECASPEQIATGQEEHRSDGTDSPKRPATVDSAFAGVVGGTPRNDDEHDTEVSWRAEKTL